MANLKKTFTKGVMNKDIDERLIPEGQFRDALNIDIVSPEGSDGGAARNRKGNTKIGDLATLSGFSTATARTIGTTVSETDNIIYYLVASDLFDGVYEFNEINGTINRVLQSNKATPSTPSKLNFNKDFYVTGFNYIDGFLLWTDNLNEPFGGSVKRWKSYAIDDDRIDFDIRVMKPAPLTSPLIEMKAELNKENNIEDRFIQFAQRWKYIDDQYSALSPFSATAFKPGTYELDYAAGNNEALLNTQNRVSVRFDTGDQFVTDIEVIFRDSKDLNIYVVESFNKEELLLPDNYTGTVDFDNNKIYTALPNSQLTKLFDNVPLKAKSQEIIDRRLVYAYYTQFYDITDVNGNSINMQYDVDVISEDISGNVGAQTFRSDRDIEIALQYGDGDGRFTTALTSQGNTTYVKPENSIKANSLVVSISNDPPSFASEYRLLIKQRKDKYYNIFPLLYYPDGVYRHFLINKSDRDKFVVGDYLIFKSDGSGPTLSNKKYKILEFEQKEKDFLGNNELKGVYFKIKTEGLLFSPFNLSIYSSVGKGANSTLAVGLLCNQGSKIPIISGTEFSCAENPIFYGTSNAGSTFTVSNQWNYDGIHDARFIFEIHDIQAGVAKLRYRVIGSNVMTAQNPTWIQENISVVANTQIAITAVGYIQTALFHVEFSQASGFDIGDSWRVNCRSAIVLPQSQSVFGDFLRSLNSTGAVGPVYERHGGFAIIPGSSWSTTAPETDRVIQAAAQIELKIVQDKNNISPVPAAQQFTSSRVYANIEEWFFEDGIYLQFNQFDGTGTNIKARSVYFRRGKNWATGTSTNGTSVNDIDMGTTATQETMSYPVRMIIRGQGANDGCDQNVIEVEFKISQLDNPLICETDPIGSDTDIFHETTETYPITNGKHHVLWDYEDFTDPNDGSGNTRIGQAAPGTLPTTQVHHRFLKGDTVNVTSSNINGTFTVTEVEDSLNIIISFPWPGSGPTTPGTAGLNHKSGTIELDQTNTVPAKIIINNPQSVNGTYNAYAFGNGVESIRIRDDFNETTLEYSPRSTTSIEDYRQETKEASLTYSGIYRGESSINRLNEFNLSLSNFRNIDRGLGSIQKLYARDTDLVVFQEDKITKILYGKNLLSDSIGGGSVTSIPEVLGTQIPFVGEWGISSNPESFAIWGNHIFFTDQRRGAVLKMTSGGIFDISLAGMKSHFRDLMKDNPNTQKLGVYDPYNSHYIVSSNENSSLSCLLSIDNFEKTYPGDNTIDVESEVSTGPDFSITSNSSWSMSITYESGSGWVGFPPNGFGNSDIYLSLNNNTSGFARNATITITYCGGKTVEFRIKQGAGRKVDIITWVSNNQTE